MPKPRKTGLGKGLDALFADNETGLGNAPTSLSLHEMEPNRAQPRRDFDPEKLEELAASIAEHGVITPLLVRPLPGGRYQIVAGERRWRAARMAGLTELPAVVRQLTDAACMQLALVENLQRDDLNPVEEARGYRTLAEEHGMTQAEIAQTVGRSRPMVTNAMRLLSLPDSLLGMVEQNVITAGHARALVGIPEESALEIARRAAAQGLNVRQTEALAARAVKAPRAVRGKAPPPAIYREAELSLAEAMGRRVKVASKGKGGVLTLVFSSEADFRELMKQLAGTL